MDEPAENRVVDITEAEQKKKKELKEMRIVLRDFWVKHTNILTTGVSEGE